MMLVDSGHAGVALAKGESDTRKGKGRKFAGCGMIFRWRQALGVKDG